MDVEKALSSVQKDIPDCVAVGYVDMTSGSVLGVKTLDQIPLDVLDLVASATKDMFQGDSVITIERLFKDMRGTPFGDSPHVFQEILIFSQNLLHFFIRGKRYPDQVSVFVCKRTANIGMVIAKTRLAVPVIEASMD